MTQAFTNLAEGGVRRCLVAGPRLGHNRLPDVCQWIDGGHPFPTEASVQAGRRAEELAAGSGPDVWMVPLLSGGASAMLALPAPGITLHDKVETAQALMRGGVAIDALNCVRKHISGIKGGQLGAAAYRSLTLAISDVHGPVPDDPSVIGSGPAVPDATTFGDALDVARSAAGIPLRVVHHLERGRRGELSETVKPGDPRLARAYCELIGNRTTALDAAQRAAQERGYAVAVVENATAGEARIAAHSFIGSVRQLAADGERPLCVLAAGETTVRVHGQGKGGRNQELVLAATPLVGSVGRAAVLASVGTDGTDGPTDAAGAIADSSTLQRAQRAGLDWESALMNNDAYRFFEALGDLIVWGPTGTNVGDVQMMLIA
jgi:glycerate 2-kinase